jgi:hypothetical protein
MDYRKGERVKHPKKPDWGVGQVLADSSGGSVKIFFTHAGEKSISLEFVQPVKLAGGDAASVILDSLDFADADSRDSKGKVACANCGGPTQFGDTANPTRHRLGWCEPCFRHSQRTFQDKHTGETRYIDELRTVDGIKSRYSPK